MNGGFFRSLLVSQIWKIRVQGPLALEPPPTSAAAQAEKMKALLGIPDGAISDLQLLESASETPSRDELMVLYNKAEALQIFFLRALASMRK